jgi:3',5'-cyclic AMP phosphodiesterase CpdA
MTEKESFTLVHLSDPHMCSTQGLSAHALMNKRIFGYLSWRLHRRTEHRKEVLAALLSDLQAMELDHIAITGDLTHLGTPTDFFKAQQFLQSLGPPSQVTVVPGNHDAYVAAHWKHTFALWTEYMASDTTAQTAAANTDFRIHFPILRIRGRIALIGVSTARPSAPLFATGRVGDIQLQKLENILTETGRQGLLRVLVIHHPPVSGVVRWRKRLTDAGAFRKVLKRCGAEMILHGHVHRSSFTQLQTPQGNAPVICVSSASALGRNHKRRARFHIYHFNQTKQQWNVGLTVHRYSDKKKHFVAESEHPIILCRKVK